MAVDTFVGTSGSTYYVVVIRTSDGGWWNTAGTPAFEAFNAANYTNYGIAATEFGSTGIFQYTIPAMAAGLYNVQAKLQAGGSPAASDTNGPGGWLDWSGTAVIRQSQLADTSHGGASATIVADITGDLSALTTALTEGYRGTGATGSIRDLLYELIAHMGNAGISGTTKTLKKLDGSTTAKTYTLDSTTPTSIAETT